MPLSISSVLNAAAALLLGLLTMAGPARAADVTAHDFSFRTIDGDPLPLATYRGQVLVVVNTASECGFTYQYEGLQALWDRYRERGVVVLGVPSNDFGGQEPGSAEEIKEFCEVTFGIDFPLAEKISVKGPAAHPFYAWARGAAGDKAIPRWNFHKIVIGQDGRIVEAFASNVEPLDSRVTDLIDGLLPESLPEP